ncbi:hypothetical protein PIB30_045350 [Stylosanthes scabra]|uniref:Uncharacterized protein n=1 Tax=Stylosanthes scabra TaxID=79078 RepID=A0ABU6QGP2_9FABA|nr:hypothetical protein [Stylosanthes scabra]
MVEWVEVNPVPKVLGIHNSGGPRSLQTRVELGFKETRPWPGNAKFQFWHSFNITLQRKVAYAIYGSCIRNFVQRALWTLQGRKLRMQLSLAASSVLAPLHESFASNAFLSLSQALFNP